MKCNKHPNETLAPLKYQKYKDGKQVWHTSPYHYCEQCKTPMLVKVTVEVQPITTTT